MGYFSKKGKKAPKTDKTNSKPNKIVEIKEVLKTRGLDAMGYGQVARYAMRDPDLPLTSKAIYAFMCSMCGGGGNPTFSRDLIVDKLKIGKDTYYRYRKILVDQGYISIEHQKDEKGYFYRTDFIIEDKPKKFDADKRYDSDASRTYGKFTFSGIKAAGYGNVSRAVMYDGRLSTKAKGLYAYFVSYAGGGNQATPPLKTILYHLGVTETSYHKYLAELTSLNYVIITQKHINGQLSCNDYHIVSNPDEECAVQPKRNSKKIVLFLDAEGKPLPEKMRTHQDAKNPDMDESLAAQKVHQDTKKPDTDETVVLQGIRQDAKNQDMEKQDTAIQDMENQDTRKPASFNTPSSLKIPSFKSSFLEKHSIYPSKSAEIEPHWIDLMDRNAIKEYILDHIGFNSAQNSLDCVDLARFGSTILSLVDLVSSVLTRKTPTIRIGREDKPRSEVFDALLSLELQHYKFVAVNVHLQTTHIRNVPQYYLTSLYNSLETIAICLDRGNEETAHTEWLAMYPYLDELSE